MNGNAKKHILIAVAVVAVCVVAVVIALVMLLAPEQSQLPNHIVVEQRPTTSTGELSLKLVRQKLTTKTLNSRGIAVEREDNKAKDFSTSRQNIFGIDSDMLIGPSCFFQAEMTVTNTKPYDFEYWLEITPKDGKTLLADQIVFTVTADGQELIDRSLADGLTTPVTAVSGSGGAQSRFTARLEYIDVQNNNETQNSTLAFDMVVHVRLR